MHVARNANCVFVWSSIEMFPAPREKEHILLRFVERSLWHGTNPQTAQTRVIYFALFYFVCAWSHVFITFIDYLLVVGGLVAVGF